MKPPVHTHIISNFLSRVRSSTLSFLEKHFLIKKLNTPVGFVFLSLMALFFSAVIWVIGYKLGFVLLILILGTPLLAGCALNIRYGLLMTIGVSYFIYHLKRVTNNYELETGVMVEACLLAAFLGIFLTERHRKSNWWSFKNPITFAVALYAFYIFMQALNPNASNLSGWIFMLRAVLGFILLYILTMHAFSSLSFVKLFTKIWLGLALFVALYGIYQELFGFFDFEMRWIYSSEERFKRVFIWGRFRKMSILSDPAAFGIFMGYSGITCLCLLTGPFKKGRKILLFVAGALMLIAMSYSGTRTAYAMVPAGLSLFGVISLTNKKTLIFSVFLALAFLGIVFGPFHSPVLERIRSTFEVADNPSFQVRQQNRQQIQPYIHNHPIGGGIATSGVMGKRFSPDHELAGFPPDSAMLKTAMELGWIGLLIDYFLNFTVLYIGIVNYFKARNKTVKTLYMAYMASFFGITIANYAQVALGQRPVTLLFYATMALMVKLIEFDDNTQPEKTITQTQNQPDYEKVSAGT